MNEFKLVPMEPTEAMIEAARDQHEGEPYLPVSLYKAMLAAAPDVQGEPAGWQFYQHGEWWFGDDHDHRKNTEEAGFRVRDVYAAPQPAEQQPDATQLVEALEDIAQWSERWTAPGHPVATIARKALAAYRKGGEA